MISSIKRLFTIQLDRSRNFGLDLLRALAIIFVMIEHGDAFTPEFARMTVRYVRFDGVSIFFVLSGFLIGTLLIRQLEKYRVNLSSLFTFWIRRWLRTIPAFFLVFTTILFLTWVKIDNFNPLDYKSYYIFSQNLFSHNFFVYPEAWSLSVEEWFYLLIPVLLFLCVGLFRMSVSTALLLTAITVLLAVTGFRLYRFELLEMEVTQDWWDLLFRKQVSTRLDALMYGVIGAYFAYFKTALWLKYKNQLFVLGLLVLFTQQTIAHFQWHSFGMYYCVFSFSINSLGTILLIPYLTKMKPFTGRAYRFFSTISVLSYAMYLINLSLVFHTIMLPLPWDEWIFADFWMNFFQLLTFWFVTIGLSVLIYKYFEIPMMKLRDARILKKWLKLTPK